MSETPFASRSERRAGGLEQVQAGAHDLGLAAETVGVLDARAVGQVRSADRAAGEQPGQPLGDPDLTLLTAHPVEPGIERHVAAEGGIDAHGARDQGRLEDRLRPEPADQGERGRDLGAVEQRQALLGLKLERRRPDRSQNLGGRSHDPGKANLALAEQAAGEMGERRQVAGGADRALGRDHRQGVMVEELQQQLDGPPLHPGMAEREARGLERQDQADHGVRERRAEPAHV